MTTAHPSNEFPKRLLKGHVEARGAEMYVAVWTNRGRGHVMIGAPTLEALSARWEQITHSDFMPEMAQYVVVLDVADVASGFYS